MENGKCKKLGDVAFFAFFISSFFILHSSFSMSFFNTPNDIL
jgi:hypothetical protein